jgi:hypothetical protein
MTLKGVREYLGLTHERFWQLEREPLRQLMKVALIRAVEQVGPARHHQCVDLLDFNVSKEVSTTSHEEHLRPHSIGMRSTFSEPVERYGG